MVSGGWGGLWRRVGEGPLQGIRGGARPPEIATEFIALYIGDIAIQNNQNVLLVPHNIQTKVTNS